VNTEQKTFGTRDPRDDGKLDRLARLTYGHTWNDLSPAERQQLALSACKLLSIDQGRRVCTGRGIINPKCGPGCPLHEPYDKENP